MAALESKLILSQPQQLHCPLPEWITPFLARQPQPLISLASRMGLVLDAVEEQIHAGSGGPFAAAIFTRDTGQLIALGVNLVPVTAISMLHAEMVAITLAQIQLGRYNLGAEGYEPLELVSSSEPCAMCLGALPWAGVRRLVISAADPDVRAIGFDEGDKPEGWQQKLQQRGIEVMTGVEQQRGQQLLQRYRQQGGGDLLDHDLPKTPPQIGEAPR